MNIINKRRVSMHTSSGFTIVELIVVIIAMAILSAIVLALYENIGTRAYDVSLQSDLDNGKTDLEVYAKKNIEYPSSETELNNGVGFIESQGNVITYLKKPYGYCMTASNPEAEHSFMVRSINGKITEGDCMPTASIIAGSPTATGYQDGTGSAARFSSGNGTGSGTTGNGGSIIVTPENDIYITDHVNWRIRKITQEGEVTTFAGGPSGCAAGMGTAAALGIVMGLVYDTESETLYFLGCSGSRIFKATPDGNVSMLSSTFYWARGLALGPDGMLYVMGTEQFKIYKVNPTTGVSTVFAGAGQGYADGVGTAALFDWPWSGIFNSEGNLIVKDRNNNRLREIKPDGTVTTVVGSGTSGLGQGTGTAAQMYYYGPHGITMDRDNKIYVFESNSLRTITPQWEIAPYNPAASRWYSSTNYGGSPLSLTFGKDGILYMLTARCVVKVIL